MNIFRTATKQAIRDIIEDNASNGRYGVLLSDSNIEAITERVVDLFEMTLSLRAQVSGGASQPTETRQKSPGRTPTLENLQRTSVRNSEPAGFPKTKWAAEIYDNDQAFSKAANPEPGNDLPIQLDLKLPRKRIGLTQSERDKLGK